MIEILTGKLNIDQQTINVSNVSDSIEDNVVPIVSGLLTNDEFIG